MICTQEVRSEEQDKRLSHAELAEYAEKEKLHLRKAGNAGNNPLTLVHFRHFDL